VVGWRSSIVSSRYVIANAVPLAVHGGPGRIGLLLVHGDEFKSAEQAARFVRRFEPRRESSTTGLP